MGNCRSKSCPASIEEEERSPKDLTNFSSLPQDLLLAIAFSLSFPNDLISFSSIGKSPSKVVQDADALLWGSIVKKKWNHHSLIEEAVEITGSYRAFAMDKIRSSKHPGPEGWFVACESEQLAAIRRIGSTLKGFSGPGSLVFLIDGSGSVSPEEFQASIRFIIKAAKEVRQMLRGDVKVSVVQFSSGARVEYPLEEEMEIETQDEGFARIVNGIARIGGGTYLNDAFVVAGKIFKAAASRFPLAAHAAVLICDGRIDSAQAREAKQMTQQLADEHHPSMFAFGVGRGVEKEQLEDVIAPCAPNPETHAGRKYMAPSERYMDLFYKLDGPW